MKRFLPQISLPRLAAACLIAALAVPSPAAIFKKKSLSTPQKATPKDPLAGNTSKQPDKVLFDKAMTALKKGKYDVARLDLQALLSTYPDSEYQMRAKLAVGDSWFKEGGTAALQQAESEYKDFITFFPNTPEAAEAQMKVADIYYMQMEKPDRDATNVERADQEYRTMIQQYPDSPLVPRAKQKLREVQEVLAERQFEIGSFYGSRENYPASIARLETVTENYPLFSHSDLALIGLGDAFAAEARVVQTMNLAPKAKQDLIKVYDDRATAAYDRVITRYSNAPHVEDARERLIALSRPMPEPTQQQLAASEAEEQSRINVSLRDRAMLLVRHGPSTITAARVGEPTMADPRSVTAPEVNKGNAAMLNAAVAGKPLPAEGGAATTAANNNPAPANGSSAPAAGLSFQNVPDASGAAAPAGGGSGPAIGASIIAPGSDNAGANGAGNSGAAGAVSGTAPDAAGSTGTSPVTTSPTMAAPTGADAPPENAGGLAPVGPTNNAPLPPVEKPAEAPAQVNDVKSGAAQVQTGTASNTKPGKKNPKPKFDSSQDSSSKHKKKKGIDKVNPF